MRMVLTHPTNQILELSVNPARTRTRGPRPICEPVQSLVEEPANPAPDRVRMHLEMRCYVLNALMVSRYR